MCAYGGVSVQLVCGLDLVTIILTVLIRDSHCQLCPLQLDSRLSETPHLRDDGLPCWRPCSDLFDVARWGDFLKNISARFGPPEILVTQLGTGAGFGVLVTNLVNEPITVETLNLLPSKVWLQMQVHRISDINQKTQTFKMHYTVSFAWRDCRLLHDHAWALQVPQHHPDFAKFWSPPFSIKEQEDEIQEMQQKHHRVTGFGMDFFSSEHVSIFRCRFQFAQLPYDEHLCNLSLSLRNHALNVKEDSRGAPRPYVGFVLEWHPLGEPITSDDLTEPEWEVDQGARWNAYTTTGQNFGLMKTYEGSVAVASFRIKRRPRAKVMQYVVPTIFFYFVSWVGMFIDVHAVPARTFAVFTPLLMTTNTMNALYSALPQISESTRLSNFVMISLIFNVVHVIEFVLRHYAVTHGTKLMLRHRAEGEADKASASAEGEVVDRVHTSHPLPILIRIAGTGKQVKLQLRWLSPLVYIFLIVFYLWG